MDVFVDTGDLQAAVEAIPQPRSPDELRQIAQLLSEHAPEEWARIVGSASPETRSALLSLVEAGAGGSPAVGT